MSYLDSGVRVITSPSANDLGLSTVGVYVYSGSAFETDANNGVSSIVKHLLPQGNANKTGAQRAAEVEAVGGKICSTVGRDSTSFYGSSLKDGVPVLLKVMSEVVHPNDVTQAQLDSAKTSLLAKKASLSTEAIIDDYIHSAAFQGTPFAQSTYGETSSIKNLTPLAVKDFVSKNYTANRVVVVGTGAVDHQAFTKLVDQNFASLPKGPELPHVPHIAYTGSEIRIRDDSFHTLKVLIGYEAVGYNDPNYWTILVLQQLIGAWEVNSGSAPYSTFGIAEPFSEEKLGTKFRAVYHPYRESGLFGIYFETDEGNSEDATYEVQNQIQKIFSYTSPEELQGARNRALAKVLQSYSGTALTNTLGNFGLFSKAILHPADIAARVSAVDFCDIQKFIDTYLYDVDPVCVSYGPSSEFPEYNILRGWTYWNRW
jgi:processing peptidase subunit beta